VRDGGSCAVKSKSIREAERLATAFAYQFSANFTRLGELTNSRAAFPWVERNIQSDLAQLVGSAAVAHCPNHFFLLATAQFGGSSNLHVAIPRGPLLARPAFVQGPCADPKQGAEPVRRRSPCQTKAQGRRAQDALFTTFLSAYRDQQQNFMTAAAKSCSKTWSADPVLVGSPGIAPGCRRSRETDQAIRSYLVGEASVCNNPRMVFS